MITTICLLFLSAILLLLYLRNKFNDFDQIYDECNEINAKYRYLIRLIFNNNIKYTKIIRSSIQLGIYNAKGRQVSRIVIPPNWMTEKATQLSENKAMIEFILKRNIPLLEVRNIRLNHKSKNEKIFVYELQIQNYVSKSKALVALIGTNIKSLPFNNQRDQWFECLEKNNSIPKDKKLKKKSSELNCEEIASFLFIAINFIGLFCTLFIPCYDKGFNLCNSYQKSQLISSIFASIFSALISVIIMSALIVIYKVIIKSINPNNTNIRKYLRIISILIIVIIALFCGLITAIFTSNERHFEREDLKFWLCAYLTGILLFALLCIPKFLTISLVLRFRTKESKDLDFETGIVEKITKKSSEELNGSHNYKDSKNKNLKSVSQYKGIKK
jgi:hypothetical protein